jgi:hypothetical protein
MAEKSILPGTPLNTRFDWPKITGILLKPFEKPVFLKRESHEHDA